MEDTHGHFAPNFNDFGLHDFIINDAHFDQYFDPLGAETAQNHGIPHAPIVDFNHDYTSSELMMINNNHANNCFLDYDQNAANNGDLFGFNSGTVGPSMPMSNPSSMLSSSPNIEYFVNYPSSILPSSSPNIDYFVNYPGSTLPSSLPNIDYIVNMKGGDEDEDDDEDNSSGTTTPNATAGNKNSKKGDRSRTLVSERRRRGSMKEKLYALRALVPNITKMDKASIVGDAVLYVQEMQKQAKQLKADIASLESSLAQGGEKCQGSLEKQINFQFARNGLPISKKIIQMDMYQVEERGFYVRLVSNNGEGVAVSLYKAIESFTNFTIQNSNLATQSDKFILAFTMNMNARDLGEGINLQNLKIWITGSLLNQGFEFNSHP